MSKRTKLVASHVTLGGRGHRESWDFSVENGARAWIGDTKSWEEEIGERKDYS